MSFKKLVAIFLLLFCAFNAIAVEEFEITQESSGSFVLVTFKLDSGAKIYWRHPGEVGLATKFDFKKSINLKSAEILWPTPVLYNNYGISSYIYEQEVAFPIKVLAKDSSKPINLRVHINFTICSKSCSNHEVDFDTIVDSNVPISQKTINALNKTPYISNDVIVQKIEQSIMNNKHYLSFYLSSNKDIKDPIIFIDLPEYVHFDPSKYIFEKLQSQGENGYLFKIPFSLNKDKKALDVAHINIVTDDLGSIELNYVNNINKNQSMLLIILYALIGGFILNFMPCVLPILALKMLQVSRLSGKEAKFIKYDMIAQSFGVITSFIIVAFVTFFLKQIGSQVGFGIHFQQPIYIITMTIILSLIAINLLSKNEIHFPVPYFISQYISLEQKGIISFFLTGILSTLLAIPCTAPFVTIAVGFAVTTDFYSMLIIFICLGIGMSFPYIILAVSPKLMKLFPKPGSWMEKFRKLLGVLIFTTSLWMIYIIYSQMGIRAAISLFLLIILVKFILTKNFKIKWLKAIIFISLVSLCYVVPHYIYKEYVQENELKDKIWEKYNPNKIGSLISDGKIIILDITASWCPTCKINKFTTFDNMLVVNFMRKNNIIGMRADISKNSSSEIFTLMRMHSHYGIPFNIIYSKQYPQGIVLPTILLPNILISAIKKADPRMAE
jgi:suppressor for copper-sensitivity B